MFFLQKIYKVLPVQLISKTFNYIKKIRLQKYKIFPSGKLPAFENPWSIPWEEVGVIVRRTPSLLMIVQCLYAYFLNSISFFFSLT